MGNGNIEESAYYSYFDFHLIYMVVAAEIFCFAELVLQSETKRIKSKLDFILVGKLML